jgi:hypothetical protein
MNSISILKYVQKTATVVVTLAVPAALIWPLPALAGGISSARSVAMGGAHIGLAKGVDAAKYNPANLGLTGYQQTGLEFAGVGANVTNNAFSLDDYNLYTGAFLTNRDKQDILDKVPEEGLRVSADVEATALAFATGPFVLATTGVGSAAINLNKDILNLILNGNTFTDTISVTGSYSDAVGYATAGLSWGTCLLRVGDKELAVGGTVKYIRGFGIERVIDMEGMAVTHEYGYAGEGRLVARTATGGKGYGLDLGAALKLSRNYTFGVSVANIFSSISWNKETQEHGYIFRFDTMTVENSGDDDLVVSEDYSEDILSFSTSLPPVMTVGFAKTSGNFVWAVDYVQGFRKEAAGASTKPRISVGTEWSLLRMLPLRAGFSAGENKSTAFSFGSGLDLLAFYMDAACVVGSHLSGYSAKGLNLAVSTGLHF